MKIAKIISGGQTGADQGGLDAGLALGLQTGGFMPLGWRTQAGPRPDMQAEYGMMEHVSAKYPPRTEANVVNSHATLVFGNKHSPGCSLTLKLCEKHNKPVFVQVWTPGNVIGAIEVQAFQTWLSGAQDAILNVAGNREESKPGIHDACMDFLIRALTDQ